MPQAASKKQYRFLMAILHGKNVKNHPRGNPPKSVASKYSSPGDGAPESKDNDRGGHWGEGAHKKAKAKTEAKRTDRKKKKAASRGKLKKSFEQYYRGQGAGVVVVNKKGQILVGKCSKTGMLCTPGGHVDPGETYEEAAKRELFEEAGIKALDCHELGAFKTEGNDSKVFLVTNFAGRPNSKDNELEDLKWVDSHTLAVKPMREASKRGILIYLQSHLKKSVSDLVTIEELEKNILRGPDGRTANYEVTHGDALKLVGNGVFRMIREAVQDMGDEDFKDLHVDNYTISIRKHLNDVYSGRVNDGHKTVHQFTNRSLPQVCADLMSVFEWYLPEDHEDLEILSEDNLPDDAIHGGLNELVDNYRKHNLAEIYREMENMRNEIRQGNAVDLMQVEAKVMKLFDKLEQFAHNMTEQHNKLCGDAGDEVERLESKLLELQSKIDSIGDAPKTIEAYSSNPADSNNVYTEGFFYLPKPSVTIEPTGKIQIAFDREWSSLDRENFLSDMRAKAIKSK